ncbi:MAG: fucose isomerase, partial [Bryobacteraceae bacterium]
MSFELASLPAYPPAQPKQVYMVASGDSRPAANRTCWPAQAKVEGSVTEAINAEGWSVQRAHGYDESQGHGFISGQRMGMDVFERIPPDAPLIVVEAVWQYSHHVLPGLRSHRGPILTIANFSGQWPGLVGLLNLNASLAKAGVAYSSLWSENFKDEFFLNGIRRWLRDRSIRHDLS